MGNPRRSSRKPRQTQLAFSPLPSSSPAASRAAEEHGKRSYAAVRFEDSPAKRRMIYSARNIREDEARLLPTPTKSSQLPLSEEESKAGTDKPVEALTSSSAESEPVQQKKRRHRARQGRLDFSNHIGVDVGESEEQSAGQMRHRNRLDSGIFGTQPKRRVVVESSEDGLMSSIRQERSPATASTRQMSQTTRSGRKAKQPVVIESSDDEDDLIVEAQARAKVINIFDIGEPETSGDDVPAMQSSPTKKPRRREPTPDFIELSSSVEEASDTNIEVASAAPRRRKRTRQKYPEEEDDTNDSPVNRSRTPRTLTQRDLEDLDEDLEFLQSSPPPASRSARSKPSSARESALKALRRRRANQTAPPERLTSEEDEDEEQSEEEWVDNRRDMFLEDDKDEGFVVDDDPNDLLGAPVDMPLEFSNVSRMKIKDLFKIVVEWMVQKKINPAFAIDDEIYNLAFRKVDDEVRGLVGSKFTSAAWTVQFTNTLQARPGIVLSHIGGLAGEMAFDHCGACNRSGHPATWDVQFYGKPYDPITLEEMDNGSDEDDDSDQASEEYDSRGRLVAPEDKTFHLGRFCKDNATTAHALQHWRYHLNEYVVDYLKDCGYTTPEKTVRRDSYSTKKRRREANRIVDEMERCGKIRSLYDDFRREINAAREVKSAFPGRR